MPVVLCQYYASSAVFLYKVDRQMKLCTNIEIAEIEAIEIKPTIPSK